MRRNAFPALLLAIVLCGCTAQMPAETQTTPQAAEHFPVWGERVFQQDCDGEGAGTDTPEGATLSLRFVLPYIKNAGEIPAWERLNEHFASRGDEWLQKGREYWGTPGLEPGGHYSVESVYTIQRCDHYLSVRYQRTEALAGEPAVTVSGELFDLTTGDALISLDSLLAVPAEEGRDALLDALDGLEGDPYDREYYEGYFSFTAFYLTEEELVLLFPVYADGATLPTSTLERPIPLGQLQKLLIPALQDAPAEGA